MSASKLDIFHAAQLHRMARSTDPHTSHAAAESVSRSLPEMQLAVLKYALIKGDMGFTDSEMSAALGYAACSTARSRRKELETMGLLRNSLRTRKNERGRQEIIWVITQTGINTTGENSGSQGPEHPAAA